MKDNAKVAAQIARANHVQILQLQSDFDEQRTFLSDLTAALGKMHKISREDHRQIMSHVSVVEGDVERENEALKQENEILREELDKANGTLLGIRGQLGEALSEGPTEEEIEDIDTENMVFEEDDKIGSVTESPDPTKWMDSEPFKDAKFEGQFEGQLVGVPISSASGPVEGIEPKPFEFDLK